MSGIKRLRVAQITQSKARGKALLAEIGASMNSTDVPPQEGEKKYAKRRKK